MLVNSQEFLKDLNFSPHRHRGLHSYLDQLCQCWIKGAFTVSVLDGAKERQKALRFMIQNLFDVKALNQRYGEASFDCPNSEPSPPCPVFNFLYLLAEYAVIIRYSLSTDPPNAYLEEWTTCVCSLRDVVVETLSRGEKDEEKDWLDTNLFDELTLRVAVVRDLKLHPCVGTNRQAAGPFFIY